MYLCYTPKMRQNCQNSNLCRKKVFYASKTKVSNSSASEKTEQKMGFIFKSKNTWIVCSLRWIPKSREIFPEVEDSTIEDQNLDFCGVHEKTEQLQGSFGPINRC